MVRRSRSIFIITVALGLVLACGPFSTGLSPSPTGASPSTPGSGPASNTTGKPATQAPTLAPNPLNVQITLDTASAQTSSGMFYLQVASGANFAMILPEDMAIPEADGSLVPATGAPVTMTPVSAIAGIPFSQGFLAAVDLTPQGMLLIEPTTLTLTLPGEYDPATLVGFASDSNGDNFHLYPVKISAGLSMPGVSSGGTIVGFELSHFTMYGVAQASMQEILAQHGRVPVQEISQAEDLLSPLVPLDQKIINQLTFQHDTRVRPAIDRLISMEGDCNQVDVVAQQFIAWHANVRLASAESEFTEEVASDTAILLGKLVKCMIPSCSVCLDTPPGNKQQTDEFLIHAYYAEQISKIAGLPYESFRYWTLANQCAKNTGRPLPHANVDAGCGNDCPVDDTATVVPPACPVP